MDFKKTYIIILLAVFTLFGTININAQSVVLNKDLLTQLQKNHIKRVIMDAYVRNNIKKSNDSYSKTEQHLTKVAIVKEAILHSLTNVESGMKQGKQVKNIMTTFSLTLKEMRKLLKPNALINADFFIMKSNYVSKYKSDVKDFILEMTDEVLKVKKGYLMDYQARQTFLDKIQSRVNQIYYRTKALTMLFENYQTLSYLHRNPTLSMYVNKDLYEFNSLITNLKNL